MVYSKTHTRLKFIYILKVRRVKIRDELHDNMNTEEEGGVKIVILLYFIYGYGGKCLRLTVKIFIFYILTATVEW